VVLYKSRAHNKTGQKMYAGLNATYENAMLREGFRNKSSVPVCPHFSVKIVKLEAVAGHFMQDIPRILGRKTYIVKCEES